MFGRKKDIGEDGDLFVIAGLGNPGSKFEHTRHNMGFDAVDYLADHYGIRLNHRKFNGIYGQGQIAGRKVILVEPQTFMNNSGECIAPLLSYYKVDPAQNFLVIFDDISLEPGHLRVKAKGSAGGHNGIKSIIAQTGTDQFSRIKLGVGEKPEGWDLADHVLGHFDTQERKKADEAISHIPEAVELILQGKMQEAMNRFNRKETAG